MTNRSFFIATLANFAPHSQCTTFFTVLLHEWQWQQQFLLGRGAAWHQKTSVWMESLFVRECMPCQSARELVSILGRRTSASFLGPCASWCHLLFYQHWKHEHRLKHVARSKAFPRTSFFVIQVEGKRAVVFADCS